MLNAQNIPYIKKGPWEKEEDEKIFKWVKINGPQKWQQCSDTIPGRNSKQCRERWFNGLKPDLKKEIGLQKKIKLYFKDIQIMDQHGVLYQNNQKEELKMQQKIDFIAHLENQ
ncbi:myb-like DNA-binding domain protein [Ichthyophthirius multifiliis]|uniref:Myb-like DNA-binding domain protein n=1 Tax=Ichthyophthirius multifiliis TaxID=5932 RepID=G0R233_ICHMU|nr:myb-like DNA-binding domain protein [Ichthyophthirius multifiliis]EGR28475.1 myb-like DNA-binding domain protein [Ichthyophthirius multifiliis]|eukprot:XP_004029711.1 myb-like DNA-binding domain protein [Ichthyophthirius multifiliis]